MIPHDPLTGSASALETAREAAVGDRVGERADAGHDAVAALEGDLARFPALDVMQFVKLSGASGLVVFERHGERIEIGFDHGRPVWATSTGRSVRLGESLVHRGGAHADDVREALDAQRAEARPLGTLLRERGVDDAAIVAAAGDVFRRLVRLVSLWPDGRFRLAPGAPDFVDDAALDVELDRLTLEGHHQADLFSGVE